MSFKSVLDDIGKTVAKVFEKINPVIQAVDSAIIVAAPEISLIPGFGAAIESVANTVAQVEAVAATANAQNGTGIQKLALALPQASADIISWAEASGLSLKSAASATNITKAVVAILNEFGSTTSTTPTAPVATTPAPAPASVNTTTTS